jgi:hypothetical protein
VQIQNDFLNMKATQTKFASRPGFEPNPADEIILKYSVPNFQKRRKALFVAQLADNLSRHTLMRVLQKAYVRIPLFL